MLALIASFIIFALIHPELSGSLSAVLPSAVTMIVVWSIGEELGWRGYALPRLMEQMGPVWASLVIGIAWWMWHTPGWLVGFGAPSDISYWAFGVWVVSASFVFTYFYVKSKGNVWTAVLLQYRRSTGVRYPSDAQYFRGGSCSHADAKKSFTRNLALAGPVSS